MQNQLVLYIKVQKSMMTSKYMGFGPLGVEMKNNIKRLWWKRFIQESPYNVGLDSAIFMNPKGMGSFRTCWWFL